MEGPHLVVRRTRIAKMVGEVGMEMRKIRPAEREKGVLPD
jgi:hypothetical protein